MKLVLGKLYYNWLILRKLSDYVLHTSNQARVSVFDVTFNNIFGIRVKHQPVASLTNIITFNVVWSTHCNERDMNSQPQWRYIVTDCIGSCKSNYHTTTADMYTWYSYLREDYVSFIFYLLKAYKLDHEEKLAAHMSLYRPLGKVIY